MGIENAKMDNVQVSLVGFLGEQVSSWGPFTFQFMLKVLIKWSNTWLLTALRHIMQFWEDHGFMP